MTQNAGGSAFPPRRDAERLSVLSHHQDAIDIFVQDVAATARFQAVILTGSLAQGRARPDSDIDAYLVVSGDDYAERASRHDLAHIEACAYDGGYIDGKVVSRQVLEAAADRGSEPTRASFANARIVYSAIGDLQPLIDRISRYPEDRRAANLTDFFCHFVLHAGYFGPSALKKNDPFLLHHAVTNMVLFGGRLMLTYNRQLFPCPKQLLDALRRCRELPDGFLQATQELLEHPDGEAMSAYLTLVAGFTDWGVPQDQIVTRFMELDEWSWLDGCASVAQR